MFLFQFTRLRRTECASKTDIISSLRRLYVKNPRLYAQPRVYYPLFCLSRRRRCAKKISSMPGRGFTYRLGRKPVKHNRVKESGRGGRRAGAWGGNILFGLPEKKIEKGRHRRMGLKMELCRRANTRPSSAKCGSWSLSAPSLPV